ncbi:MAG TPA: hypothetical protein VLZ83_05475 [Edaphocola sp.]|nr:hypothetical protein [Edaphocola sp.]
MKIPITREIKISILNALRVKEINEDAPDQKALIEAIRKITPQIIFNEVIEDGKDLPNNKNKNQ